MHVMNKHAMTCVVNVVSESRHTEESCVSVCRVSSRFLEHSVDDRAFRRRRRSGFLSAYVRERGRTCCGCGVHPLDCVRVQVVYGIIPHCS